MLLADAPVGALTLSMSRAGMPRTVTLDVQGPKAALASGVHHERLDTSVGVADPNSPAGRAGVLTGDLIQAVNGQDVSDWTAVTHALAGAGSQVTLRVKRGEEQHDLTMTGEPWTPPDPVLGQGPVGRWGL